MWRLIIIGLLFYLILRLLKSFTKGVPGQVKGGQELVQDALTKVYFDKQYALVVSRNGRTLYFASKENRDQYLSKQP